MATHFEVYLQALDARPDRDGVLGEGYVIHPPSPDYGYDCTPPNAVTFGCMGADGVHYAVLTHDGVVSDESPVVQVCPMDFDDPYQVLGESFLGFLADGCGVSREAMAAVFAAEESGTPAPVAHLRERFQMSRLSDDGRYRALRVHLRHIAPNG